MDKSKTCKTCCKKESINEMGRCETCQTKIEQTYIERLRRKNERRKQERIANPDKFREREENAGKQTRRRQRQVKRNIMILR